MSWGMARKKPPVPKPADKPEEATGKAPERARGGKVGGKARATVFSSAERSEFARLAAQARWKKTRD